MAGFNGAQRKQAGLKDFVYLPKDNINEDSFIRNLRERYEDDSIYTYVGSMVISTNPYKQIPGLYSTQEMQHYRHTNGFEPNLHPHVFALTDKMYRDMVDKQSDHVVIISGESGAGKTEASKRVLEYITNVTGSGPKVDKVKNQLLQSNPVLEAFGNAKTNRNDNSSRFGKYMDIQFDSHYDPSGGNISNYLLEKSRVVNQLQGERNFHIFYQLLKAGPAQQLGLKPDPNHYPYLTAGGVTEVRSIDDAKEWQDVQRGLDVIGFSKQEQDNIFKVLAGILHLGCCNFVSDGHEGSKVQGPIDQFAQAIGTTKEKAEAAITNSTIVATGQVVTSPINPDQAKNTRDALAKAMYDRMFTWVVQKINSIISANETGNNLTNVIGVLDIYGFEIMKSNSFEQFCINYCNEKLQQLFIELTLKAEQEEYKREGIQWTPIPFFNNKIICELVEKKGGIISYLDEECLRPGKKDDTVFLEKLDRNFGGHDHYTSKNLSSKDKSIPAKAFKLAHYAGDVCYEVDGFIEKNMDTLFKDLSQCMFECSNPLLKSVFPEGDKRQWTGAQKRPLTSATKFKNSMAELVNNLLQKEPSYIRCIKPNENKAANQFDEKLCRHQCRYLNLVENVRIRRAGFCFRQPFDSFFQRYKILSPQTFQRGWRGDAKSGCTTVFNHLGLQHGEYQFGTTKVFIKDIESLYKCEIARENCRVGAASKIQAYWREYKYKERKQVLEWLNKLENEFRTVRQFPFNKHPNWPTPPKTVRAIQPWLEKIHYNYWAYKMIMMVDEDQRPILRRKCWTYGYVHNVMPWNFARTWGAQYISPNTQGFAQAWGELNMICPQAQNVDRNILFSQDVVKINRKGKAQNRFLFLTNTHILRWNPKDHDHPKNPKPWKMTVPDVQKGGNPLKNITAVADITKVTVTTGRDSYCVLHTNQVGEDIIVDFAKAEWEILSEFLSHLIVLKERQIDIDFKQEILCNNCHLPAEKRAKVVGGGEQTIMFVKDSQQDPKLNKLRAKQIGGSRELFVKNKDSKIRRHTVHMLS